MIEGIKVGGSLNEHLLHFFFVSFFFHQASGIVVEAIVIILTRTGIVFSGLLHSYCSVLKKYIFSTDLEHYISRRSASYARYAHAQTDKHHVLNSETG